MINTWWFKLYTQKSILWSAICFVGLVTMDLILPQNYAEIAEFFILAVVVLSLYRIMKSVIDFGNNYHFFQNSFSTKEILKIFRLHTTISFSIFFASIFLVFAVSQVTDGVIGKYLKEIVGMYSLPIIFYISILLLALFNVHINWIKSETERNRKSKSSVRKVIEFLFFCFFGFVPFGISIVLHLIGFQSMLTLSVFLVALVISWSIQSNDFLLRKKKSVLSFKGTLKGMSLGFAFAFPLFFLATYLSAIDYDNEQHSSISKAKRYELAGPFASIDRETLLEIEPHVRSFSYGTLDFDLNQEGPAFFSTSKTKLLLFDHLSKNKASEEFLVSLYDDFNQNQAVWTKIGDFEILKRKAFHAWPKKKELPERFIDLKQTTRDIASQKD